MNPIMIAFIVLALMLALWGGIVVLFDVRHAPEGHKDGRGFHILASQITFNPRMPATYRIYPSRDPEGRLSYRAKRKTWLGGRWICHGHYHKVVLVFARWDDVLDACMADARRRAGSRAGLVDQHDMDFFP